MDKAVRKHFMDNSSYSFERRGISMSRSVRKGFHTERGRKTQNNMRKDCGELWILDQGKEKPLGPIPLWDSLQCPEEHHPRDYALGVFSTRFHWN